MAINRRIDRDVVYIRSGILLSHKKNEIMPFTATWMDPEIIILSEVSQRKPHILWYHLVVEYKKKWYKWTYLQNKNRLTDIGNNLTVTKGEGVCVGEINEEFGTNRYILLYVK